MKRYVAVGVSAVLGLGVFGGCEDGDRTVSPVGSSGGSVDAPAELSEDRPGISNWRILGGNRQASTGRVEIEIEIDGERHTLVSNSLDDGRDFELTDASGERFGIRFGHDGERFLLSEWTDTDRLDIAIRELRRGRVEETYRLNDVERSWVVDHDADIPAAVYDEFTAFLPSTNSLNHNPLGAGLAALLTDPRLAEEVEANGWGHDESISSELSRLPGWVEWSCAGFAACRMIKCPFGAFANSVCSYCTGATIVCAFMALMW